ncbi:MAG: hypothetical protein JXA07_16285 [Spirochaetes bacterium]|nr:hypothetical protein [Spirochaetota bacterium]
MKYRIIIVILPWRKGEDFINDLMLWLDSDLISGPNTEFYPIMADLLRDMGDLVENSPTEEGLYMLYDYYGFQAF